MSWKTRNCYAEAAFKLANQKACLVDVFKTPWRPKKFSAIIAIDVWIIVINFIIIFIITITITSRIVRMRSKTIEVFR